jgi:hypothetical protein
MKEIECRRSPRGYYLITDGPGVEEVMLSIPSGPRDIERATDSWVVRPEDVERVVAALRSRGFTVTGISTSSGLAR